MTDKKRKGGGFNLGSVVVGIAIAVILYLIPKKTPAVTVVCLIVLGLCFLIPILRTNWFLEADGWIKRGVRLGLVLALLAVAVSVFGWYVWPISNETVQQLPPRSPLRSHIHITHLDWTVSQDPGGHAEIKVGFSNNGNLQAEGVSIAKTAFYIVDPNTARRLEFEDSLFNDIPRVDVKRTASSFTLPYADDRSVIVSSPPWGKSYIQKFIKGEASLYVAGTIFYEDENGPCQTSYCEYVMNTGLKTFFCNKHNEEPLCK